MVLDQTERFWCGLMRSDWFSNTSLNCIRPSWIHIRLHQTTSRDIRPHKPQQVHIRPYHISDDITPYQTTSVSTSPHETIRFWYGLLWTHEVWWDLMWTSKVWYDDGSGILMALNWQITWAFLFLAFKNWFVLITSYGKELLELFFCLVGT